MENITGFRRTKNGNMTNKINGIVCTVRQYGYENLYQVVTGLPYSYKIKNDIPLQPTEEKAMEMAYEFARHYDHNPRPKNNRTYKDIDALLG